MALPCGGKEFLCDMKREILYLQVAMCFYVCLNTYEKPAMCGNNDISQHVNNYLTSDFLA